MRTQFLLICEENMERAAFHSETHPAPSLTVWLQRTMKALFTLSSADACSPLKCNMWLYSCLHVQSRSRNGCNTWVKQEVETTQIWALRDNKMTAYLSHTVDWEVGSLERKLCGTAFHKRPHERFKRELQMLIIVRVVVTSVFFTTLFQHFSHSEKVMQAFMFLLFYSDGLISCSALGVWSVCVCVWCRGTRVRGEISGPHMAVI